jgi:hypothetical protein
MLLLNYFEVVKKNNVALKTGTHDVVWLKNKFL